MTWMNVLLTGLAILGGGALFAYLLNGAGAWARSCRAVSLLAVLGAALCLGAVGVRVLALGRTLGPVTLWRPGLLGATLSLRVDGLSAFFLLIISGLAAVAAWYAVGYTRRMPRVGGFFGPFLLFVLGMAGVVVMDDFFFFFVPWEFMALSSYVLVIYHRDRPENLRAGFKYFFLTHAGTLALFFGVVLVAGAAGSFGLGEMAKAMPFLLAQMPVRAHFALLLILLGFLVKAGGYPFGMWWLPDAHPAAPSPVSALLSGAMIKLGLYGILRVFLFLLPAGSWSLGWGLVLGAAGTLSLFFGTLQALVQTDSKRLLAYHSIGQVGYMLLGFGIAVALAERAPAVAALALVGGLFHLLNHACFKGLLFLNAGAFELATGERDLNRLGGLSRLMPVTALCTVVASLSIAGLPPFNGFSSKWLLVHASLWGSRGAALPFLLFGIAALFISAVTLASFLKFLGTTVWGPPSELVAGLDHAEEGMWLAPSQGLLALACIAFGLFPYGGVWLCYRAAESLRIPASLPGFEALFGVWPPRLEVWHDGTVVGLWSPLVMSTIFAAVFLGALLVRRLAAAPRRAVVPWACGSVVPAEELRFRAAGYYTPFKRFIHLVTPAWSPSWRPKPWPIVPKILNPDGWGFYPLASGTVGLFRWFARSGVGLPQIYPAWNLIGLAAAFVVLFLLWWMGV
ncbi:MAG: proton-conducting transporter membrane subunit [Acidobacteriota bacterium]